MLTLYILLIRWKPLNPFPRVKINLIFRNIKYGMSKAWTSKYSRHFTARCRAPEKNLLSTPVNFCKIFETYMSKT